MRLKDRESGATIVFVAATLFLLIGVAALAVDLSGIRLDRAIDQRVADSAASAGAITVFETGSGESACSTALTYVEANASDITGIDTDCSTIPTTCDPLTATTVTKNTGRYTINIVYPVPDGHALMTSGTIGAPAQVVTAADGSPCERIGVQITSAREPTFARGLGAPSGTTTIHAVAIAGEGDGDSTPLNLLLLDRTACHAMHASGNGGIIVGAVPDPDNPGSYLTGVGASDSDGSECGAGEGVIYKQGSNAEIRADGPPGCGSPPDDLSTPAIGEGCGSLQTFAATTPGVCLGPGCESDGPPAVDPKPLPTTMAERITRAPIDHFYNCAPNYAPAAGLDAFYGLDIEWATSPLTAASGQDIPGCSGGTAPLYNLIDQIGPPGAAPDGSYQRWQSAHPCTITTPFGAPLTGNWWIDCPIFEVKDVITFEGNVVFDGDVLVTGGAGALTIDNTGGSGLAFLRDGKLHKDGDASLALLETMVYASKTSWISMDGGSGALDWTAPQSGQFENLALWSDGVTLHEWAGQANLTMTGVFFVPWAGVNYRGTGGQNQASAQFIASTLYAEGEGFLLLNPNLGDIVPADPTVTSTLVR